MRSNYWQAGSIVIGALALLFFPHTASARPVFQSLTVDKTALVADRHDVQTARLVVNTTEPQLLDEANIIVNYPFSGQTNNARGYFNWTAANGFRKLGAGNYGAQYVNLLAENPANPAAGSERIINAAAGTVTFLFRWTANPSYGILPDNDIWYHFAERTRGFVNPWTKVETNFVVTGAHAQPVFAGLYIHKYTLVNDGQDMQEVVLNIQTTRPDLIDDVGVILNYPRPGQTSPPRGYFQWTAANGFRKLGGENYGARHVNLLPENTTNPYLGSQRIVTIQGVTFVFRWTANSSYGAVPNNHVSYFFAERTTGFVQHWAEAQTDFMVVPLQGRLNVTRTNTVPAGNVPIGATDVALGSFNFRVSGEPIDIRKLVFSVATAGNFLPTGFRQLRVFERRNGIDTPMTGGNDVVGSSSPGYATSTDNFTLGEGDHEIIVKANIDTTPANNDTIVVGLDMSNTANFDARGVNSGNNITLGTYATPQALVYGNIMTIRTASLSVYHLDTPPTSTRPAGASNIKVADVLLDARGSTEDVKVTQFTIRDLTDSGGRPIDMQNIRLWVDKDGDSYNGSGSQMVLTEVKNGSLSTPNADETFTFNLSGADQFVVKAGKQSVVTVKADIAGGAAIGKHVWKTTTPGDVAAVGVRTGNSVIPTVYTTPLGTTVIIAVVGGTIEVRLDSSSVGPHQYAAGSNGVILATFNFLATTTEDVALTSINFTQNVTDFASSSYQDYAMLYLVDEAGNVVGSGTPSSTAVMITINDNNNDGIPDFVVPTSQVGGSKLTLKANLSSIGLQYSVNVGGHQLGYKIAIASHVQALGALTGQPSIVYSVQGSRYPQGATHLMYKGIPTIDILPLDTSAKLATTADFFKFRVTANTSDVSVYKFTFDIATSGIALTSLQLVDVTNQPETVVYSQSTDPAVGTGNIYYTVDASAGGLVSSQLLDYTNGGGVGDRGDEKIISVGQPRTYVLRGTFGAGGVHASFSAGDSVTTRLVGDASLPAIGNTLMANAGDVDSFARDNDFIWSDLSAPAGGISIHSTTTADWTNGYLVNGLNSASSSPITISY